jgi:hypothetical protein
MNRDELISLVLSASSPKPVPVQINGTGELYVRVMTAYDAAQTQKKLEELKKDDDCSTGRLIAFMLCDEDGVLLFDAADQDTALKLSKLKPDVQLAIINAGNQANGAGSGNA